MLLLILFAGGNEMNIAVAIKIAEIIGIALGIMAFALVTYWKLRERSLARERGLDENPQRCEQHQTAIAVIEERLDTIEEDIKEIKDKLK